MIDESERIDVGEHRHALVGASASVVPWERSTRLGLLEARRRCQEGDVVLLRLAPASPLRTVTVQNSFGRLVELFRGELLVGVIGARDSTENAQGEVPTGAIRRGDRLQLLSAGGVIGRLLCTPVGSAPPPDVEVLGFVGQGGKVVRLADARPPSVPPAELPPVVLVAGTATGVGKTTLASRIIHVLSRRQGRAVTAVMMSGSGGKGDTLAHRAAGARHFHSFIEAGLASSYGGEPDTYLELLGDLFARVTRDEAPDVIVGELGGDLVWGNNDTLLRHSAIMKAVAGIWLVSHDVLGALGARALLASWGVRTPIAHVVSWTQNYGAMRRRYERLLREKLVDPADEAALDARLADMLGDSGRAALRRIYA